MKYDEYLMLGYPIGGGVVEGACRHPMVKRSDEPQRMRWTLSKRSRRCLILREPPTSERRLERLLGNTTWTTKISDSMWKTAGRGMSSKPGSYTHRDLEISYMVRCWPQFVDSNRGAGLVGGENAPLQYPRAEADYLCLLAGQKSLPFPPGSQYQYSSGDYFLLGLIVKRISGQSLAEFARKRVFEPLGMTRTFVEEDPTRVVDQRAVGHYKRVGDAWHPWRPTAQRW